MARTQRQNEMIDAALHLIADGGMGRLTMKRVAEEIGVTEPAVYRHFTGKSELIKALVARFDEGVPTPDPSETGLTAVLNFMMRRFEQVSAFPDLARVIFAEEIFRGDSELEGLVLEMMCRHREKLSAAFQEGQERGEIRDDIPLDMLFRLVCGPVRLLVKQWGMTNRAFDLNAKGAELVESVRKILKPS